MSICISRTLSANDGDFHATYGALLADLLHVAKADEPIMLRVTFVPDQHEVGGDRLTRTVELVGFDASTLLCADGHIQREDILAIEIL